MQRTICLGLLGAAVLLLGGAPALAEERDDRTGMTADAELAFQPEGISFGSGRRMIFSPRGDLYPQYVADPHRSVFGIQSLSMKDSQIPDSGSPRYGIKLGGRFGVLRLHPPGEPDRGFQLSLDAGFIGQFDSSQATDNIGWDGLYGLNGSYKPWQRTALRFGIQHTSSHVGDEYMERTGRTRINYTREEFYVGVSHSFGDRWQVYAEGGRAFDLRNEELQEKGRWQAGVQFESRHRFFGDRVGWYAAADSTAYEENDWDRSLNIQVGVLTRHRERVRRFGVEYYDGRSQIGEFFQSQERYVAASFWLQL